jgi:heme/copper-type cytochrome/quinol oxidase subunit 2
MKSMTDILIGVLGIVTLLAGVWQLMVFVGYRDAEGKPDMWAGTNHLYIAIVAIAIAIACVVAYFVRHPRVEEEIHVTR